MQTTIAASVASSRGDDAPEEFVREKELAARLGVSVSFIRKWERLGKLPSYRLFGKVKLYRWSEVERLILSMNTGSPHLFLGVPVGRIE